MSTSPMLIEQPPDPIMVERGELATYVDVLQQIVRRMELDARNNLAKEGSSDPVVSSLGPDLRQRVSVCEP